MEKIWVLSIRTSLPETCHTGDVLKEETYAFDSFEKARLKVRSKLKEYAFQENSMFDGKGNMIHMKNYLNEVVEDPIDADGVDDWFGVPHAKLVLEIFSSIFAGEDVKTVFKQGVYDDCNIEVTFKEDSIAIRGVGCGPINGYNPKANTNLFSMNDEKNYYIYLDDMFGQWEDASSEFYLDLKQVEIK